MLLGTFVWLTKLFHAKGWRQLLFTQAVDKRIARIITRREVAMKNFLKIICIYIITFINSILIQQGKMSELNCFEWKQFLILIINLVIMIVLFRVLKVEVKSMVVFLIIMTLSLTMASVDSSIMFGPAAKYGVYSCNVVIPEEFWAISFILSYPFSGVFTPLISWNMLDNAKYIVPAVMIILSLIVTKISTIQLCKKDNK